MGLMSSILNLGTFELSLRKFRDNNRLLSRIEIDNVLMQRQSPFERVYVYYITALTHHYEIKENDRADAEKLRIAPSASFKRFWYIGIGTILVLAGLSFAYGKADAYSTQVLENIIIATPLVAFGIPLILGWLFFRFCIGKLERHTARKKL